MNEKTTSSVSRYAELVERATLYEQAFQRERSECAAAATTVAKALVQYLDVPESRMSFAALDENLRTIGELAPIDGLPRMVLCADGRWYCGIHLHFETTKRTAISAVTFRIGIKKQGGQFRIRTDEEYLVDIVRADTLTALLERIHTNLLCDYARRPNDVRATVGFLYHNQPGDVSGDPG
jgi:hypothetical protein